MLFWQPTGRLGWFRGDSSVPFGSEIYSSVPVRIRKGQTIGAHLPPPLNRAPGAPPPPPLFPLWNGSRELNFSGRRSSFLRWSRCKPPPLFSQEARSCRAGLTDPTDIEVKWHCLNLCRSWRRPLVVHTATDRKNALVVAAHARRPLRRRAGGRARGHAAAVG